MRKIDTKPTIKAHHLIYAILSLLAFTTASPASNLHKQATAAAKAEDYLAVVEYANQMLAKSPKSLQGLCFRAFANYKLGNYDKAITDFEFAETLKCRTIDKLLIYEGLVKDYAASGQIDTAISKCTDALKIKMLFDLERDDILILRGRLYVIQKKYDLAQADFKEAIKIDLGENVYAQRELAWLNWIVANKSALAHIIETPVSMPFCYDDGHIKIMLTVNGIKNLPFIIDTGYSISVLNKNSTNLIDVQYTNQSGHITGGLGEKVKYKTGTINNIILGKDTSLTNTPMSVQDLNNVSDTTGILGTDFLKQFLVTIDYKSRTVLCNESISSAENEPRSAAVSRGRSFS
jgi:hypothetical protein